MNEKSLNEKPFEKKIIENGFEPWVVPLIEISTIKPRSSTKKVSYTNFSWCKFHFNLGNFFKIWKNDFTLGINGEQVYFCDED